MSVLELVVQLFLVLFLALLCVGFGIGVFLLLRWLLTEMARRNILVTFRTEGEIKAVMMGQKCHHYIMAAENHLIDPQGFDIFKGSLEPLNLGAYANKLAETARKKQQIGGAEYDPSFKETKLETTKGPDGIERPDYDNPTFKKQFIDLLIRANSRTYLEKTLGVAWVGFPPKSIFRYEFSWIKYSQEETADGKPSKKFIMNPRLEIVDSLFFRYPVYGIEIDDVETGAGRFANSSTTSDKVKELQRIQLRLELVIETKTINPQKTLFRTAGLSSAGEWLSAITKEIRDSVRTWVGNTDYDHLLNDKKEVEIHLERIRRQVNEGILLDDEGKQLEDNGKPLTSISAKNDYGQEILKIDLVNVDLKNKDLQVAVDQIFAAARAVERAEKEKDREVILAKGKRATAAAQLLGEADGLEAIAKIKDGAGTKMKIAKEIGNIKVLSVGRDAGPIVSLPEKLMDEASPTPENPENP